MGFYCKFCKKIEILLGKANQVTIFKKFFKFKDIAITVFAHSSTKFFLSVDSEKFFTKFSILFQI